MEKESKKSLEKNLIVDANPAKNFFVYMLIRDITLKDAIGDLIDNAVDAIKAQATNLSDLSDYSVIVNLDESIFSIKDNGEGMSTEIARKTAFNFGRITDQSDRKKTIGQFGIGMKRAFFKIGNNISVHSTTKNSQFDIDIDVRDWLKDNNWEYSFKKETLKENIPQNEETGFLVKITNLTDDAKTSFVDGKFLNLLRREIAYEHMLNIEKGLSIIINDQKLHGTNISLVCNNEIIPTFWENNYDGLSVKILAGISDKSEEEGGWYVFCNDRLILAKDKSPDTVWTGSKGDGVAMWHAQYYHFRGFVFFEADDSSKLPWNTTKTGMDMDSPVYQTVRSQMIMMTKQVQALMDKMKEEREKGTPEDKQLLNNNITQAVKKDQVPVLTLRADSSRLENKFVFPADLFSKRKQSDEVSIQYKIPKERYDKVRKVLNVKSGKEVGLETFNYFCKNELI